MSKESVRTEEEIIDGVKYHRVIAMLNDAEVFVFSNELNGEWRCVEVNAIGSNLETAKALIRLAQQCIAEIERIDNGNN